MLVLHARFLAYQITQISKQIITEKQSSKSESLCENLRNNLCESVSFKIQYKQTVLSIFDS